ncbi:hypothetical protein ZWY2020_054698 [Hordeum vulgare]|nr:hypothetical protein ZWY2020_054698 [Hordeum vulgare]
MAGRPTALHRRSIRSSSASIRRHRVCTKPVAPRVGLAPCLACWLRHRRADYNPRALHRPNCAPAPPHHVGSSLRPSPCRVGSPRLPRRLRWPLPGAPRTLASFGAAPATPA